MNQSYREPNSFRHNDESIAHSEWDNQSNYSDSNWNYGSEYGSESNYSYHAYNQGMDTSNYGGHNNSSHYQESTNDVDKAAK